MPTTACPAFTHQHRLHPPSPARSRPALLALLATASLLSLVPGRAQADIVSEGGGDYSSVPLYRAFLFGGIDADGDGGFLEQDIRGLDYASNVGPKPLASVFDTVSVGNTTAQLNGWSVSSGYFAARSFASMTVTNPTAGQGYYLVAGQGSATSVAFYTQEAAASRAVFTWRVSGTSSNPTRGDATGRLDFFATSEAGRSWNDLFNGGFGSTLFEYGAGTFSFTLPTVALGTPIYLYYWSSAYTEVGPGEYTPGQSFTITANFANTVVLEDVQLYDQFDQPISQWELQSDSGDLLFDQSGRIAPVDASPIPEPGTWALWAAGLGLMGHWRLRASARAARPDRPAA